MLDKIEFSRERYRLGHTKVFFRAGALAGLEEARDDIVLKLVRWMQGQALAYIKREWVYQKKWDQRELIKKGHVYFATPNFHLLVEENYSFSLSTEDRVNYARPSIDVLFETASFAYGEKLIGIVLTGANHDGAKGLRIIKERGGLTIVQDPKEAEVDSMPLNAIKESKVDQVLKLKDIADFLNRLG